METIEVKLENLKRISEYYEFPLAVFLQDPFDPLPETRRESIFRKINNFKEKFDKIYEECFGDGL